MSDIKSLETELKNINSTVEGISKDFHGFGISVSEAKAAMGDQQKNIDELKAAFTALELKMSKMGTYVARETKDMVFAVPEVKGMFDMIRKAASVNDGASGGYLVHPEYLSYVIGKVKDIDPIRQNASVFATGSSSFEIPVQGRGAGFSWVGETEERSETASPGFKKVNVPIMEMQAKVRMTRTILQDASFNIESYITSELIKTLAMGEAEAFVSGDGVKRPQGIIKSDEVDIIASGATNAIKMDSMMDMTAMVPWALDDECKFMMNKKTEVMLRKMKDTQGQYLWQPSLAQGMPSTFVGYPIMKCPTMPEVATGARSVVFGDPKAYAIVDRTSMDMIRDNVSESLRRQNMVEFEFSSRLGGAVISPERLVYMEVA